MPDRIKISVFGIVGSPLCVASSDGQEIYNRLNTALEANREVALSFHNVTALTSAFLNAAIGQLYGTFSEKKINSLLKVENIEQDDQDLLDRVVDNAKLYFENPERFNRVFQEVLEDEDDEV